MTRPYFSKSIRELEKIFTRAGGDHITLRTLHEELAHRRTPRAVALRQRVAAALKGEVAESPVRNPSPSAPTTGQRPANAGSKRQLLVQPPTAAGSETGSAPAQSSPVIRSIDAPTTTPEPATPDTASPARPQAAIPQLEEPATPDFTAPGPPRRQADPWVFSQPNVDALLAAWTTLEVLEPQPLPTPEELGSIGRQVFRADQHPEPWTDARCGPRGREKGVYWFVYLGEVDLSAALSSLIELFPDQSPERPGRFKGKTTMAVVVLDAEGRPARGSTFLSSFSWGYGMVRAGELRGLAGFPDAERKLCEELEKRLIHTDEDGEVLRLSAGDLQSVTHWLLGRLQLPADQVSLEPVSVRVPVWRRTFEAPEPELLNSFFLEDLVRVREAFRAGHVGAALASFVGGRSARPRADVVRDRRLLDETLAPDRIPLSRWPIRGGHSLVLMQQAAVNHASGELSGRGLVGTNGPPGTGKTTLLRDIVAKVVLDRARAMAAFEDPLEAFSHVATMSTGRYLHLYRLDESLLGHEVVVASSNNKAVENISREIPGIDAIVDDREPPLRYFATVADLIAQAGSDQAADPERSAWGLAAAVLGNAANRSRFARDFWWHPQRSMQQYLRGIARGWSPKVGRTRDEGEEAPAEVLMLENAPRDRDEALKRWREARRRFRTALERSESRRKELDEVRQALHARSGMEASLEAATVELRSLHAEMVCAGREATAAEDVLEREKRTRSEHIAGRDAHQSLRPGFFARLFGTRRYREWRERMESRVAAVDAATAAATAADRACQAARQVRDEVAIRVRRREKERQVVETRLAAIRTALANAHAELGDRLPDGRFWSRGDEERQKLAPWLGEAFQAERADLFAACFELHRAFIDAAAPRLRHNLGVAMQVLRGRKLSEKQEPARRSIWSSLFLVVPVISTTFASVSRMFGPLGCESLGWLLIDEAGQAVPQAAAGAIWRSQRVVGIGDPMQVPPVVVMPQRLIDSIMGEYGVDPEAWSAPRNSVQSLADRASWFGTTLLREDGDLWVGSPLRVHRRCEEPMFRISNQIAYDGLMVQTTPRVHSPIGEVLGESGWFDVEGSEPGHWSQAEGEVAAGLLASVLERGPSDPDIFFITPFRIVRAQLRRRLRRAMEHRRDLVPWRWVQENVGTIHTFQGRQADSVVLVLGAPGPQAIGARQWAGRKPNLLNVAVSRAMRRLYVVGSRTSWRDAGVFSMLAANLPAKPPI